MRVLATVCLAFSAGIFLAQYVLPPAALLPAAAAFGVLALGMLAVRAEKWRKRFLLIFAAAALALVYNAAYVSLVQTPNEALTGGSEDLTLELCGYASATEHGARAEVRILERGLHGKAVYYGTEALLAQEPGTRVRVKAYISSSATINENDVTSFTSKGDFLLLYNRGEESFSAPEGAAWRYLPQRLARRTQEVISAIFPERTAPLARAILLGDRSSFDEEDARCLSEVGIYHITAVSGLHCAFLLSLLTFFIGRHRRRLLSALAIPLLIFYALMVGASPSVVRACVMLIFVLLAPLFERESDAPTSLSFALALILLQNPFAVTSVSLQLSFGAVAGILWLTPKLYAAISKRVKKRWLRAVTGSFAVTAGALVFTAPLSAYYFGILSLVSPLSNLLCLWAASALFCLSFLCTALGFVFVPLAKILALAPHVLGWYLLGVSRLLAKLPYHALYFANSYLKYWLVYVYALFAACYVAKRGRWRYGAAAVLGVLTLALTVYLNTLPFAGGTLHMVALDVGQGQSVVLHSAEQTALIDCGSSNSFLSAGEAAAEYLQSAGVGTLDYLVLSHYHADHVNGVKTLLTQIEVSTMVLPNVDDETGQRDKLLQLATQHHIDILYASQEETLPLGEAKLTVYPPLGEGSTNEEGLTVLCTAGTFDVLLTGDMDGDTEERLLSAYKLPDIEVLMVGHHGSKSSTTAQLLEAVTPEVGVISVGSNSYGHPTDAALYRLSDENIAVYRTDLQGNIHITVD